VIERYWNSSGNWRWISLEGDPDCVPSITTGTRPSCKIFSFSNLSQGAGGPGQFACRMLLNAKVDSPAALVDFQVSIGRRFNRNRTRRISTKDILNIITRVRWRTGVYTLRATEKMH